MASFSATLTSSNPSVSHLQLYSSGNISSNVDDETTLKLALFRQKEWNKSVVFDSRGKILATNSSISQDDVKPLLTAFQDHDTTIAKGLEFCGERYEVHRWHPPLIYGRRNNPLKSEGIALIKGNPKSLNETIFLATNYHLPSLSSRIVPQMIAFFKTNIGELQNWEVISIKQPANMEPKL